MAWCMFSFFDLIIKILKQYFIYRDKGVKVDLGIPFELWDKPPAEVSDLKMQVKYLFTFFNFSTCFIYTFLLFSCVLQCEKLIEDHEETIEEWYLNHQDTDELQTYLCRKHVLTGPKKNQKCLDEKGETASTRNELDRQSSAISDRI